MSHSEFPIGISAVAASQFGGGQSYFSKRQANVIRTDEKLVHRHEDDEEADKNDAEDENPNPEPEPDPQKGSGFEPTYDLSKGVEHHPHVGLLLDVRL